MGILFEQETTVWYKNMSFIGRFPRVARSVWNSPHFNQTRWVQTCGRMFSLEQVVTDQMIPPPAVGDIKSYDPKIEAIVNSIADLKLHEVADLNELLKKTLNISDVPMMAAAVAVPNSASEGKEKEVVEIKEKTDFSIKMIKMVKSVKTDLNLVQAKKFVESLPKLLKEDVPKEECEELKKALEEAGATVELI